MDLLKVYLERVTPREFEWLHSYWYKGESKSPEYYQYARILLPLTYFDYESLIGEFLEYRYADRISFNNCGRWEKMYRRKMSKSDVAKIVMIAMMDRIKRGHLELYFKEIQNSNETIKIKFLEKDGVITGYDMWVNPAQLRWFGWKEESALEKKVTFALWVPPLQDFKITKL